MSKKKKNSLVPFNDSQWMGKEAEFSANAAMLGSDFWVQTGYKIKKVKADEYFLFSFGVPFEKLNIEDEEVNVITLTNEDKFLYEIMKTADGTAIILMEDNLVFLKRVSERVDVWFEAEALDKSKEKSDNGYAAEENEKYKSGIILGIRSQKESGIKSDSAGIKEYEYKTLWIAADNKVLHPVLETKDILLPRMNGFWKISATRINDGLRDENVFYASRFPKTNPKQPEVSIQSSNIWGSSRASVYNKIDYVGNDYISVESTEKEKLNDKTINGSFSRLWLVPIDSLASPKGVEISDLAGNGGISALVGAKGVLVASPEFNQTQELNKNIEYENFGVKRRTGHWVFEGRYNYLRGEKALFSDFKINLIPPSSVVYYDTLCMPWTTIKDRVPEAIDAYTSPRKDIAIIRTSRRLYVYAINNGALGNVPLRKIRLQAEDTIILAEWSGGNKYVQKWENVFLADKAVVVG